MCTCVCGLLGALSSWTPGACSLTPTLQQARHKDRIVGVTWLILEAIELDPGSTYEARLRVQMATLEDGVTEEERHEGQWSEWSQPVCFPSPQRGGGSTWRLLTHSLGLGLSVHPTPPLFTLRPLPLQSEMCKWKRTLGP